MKRALTVLLAIILSLFLVGCGENDTAYEQTDVEKFAVKNNISVELAQSIENALSQADVPSALSKLNDWEQADDYADGQRYTGWVYSNSQERYYYMVFYVQGDTVVSIRDQQNGLDYLYQRES